MGTTWSVDFRVLKGILDDTWSFADFNHIIYDFAWGRATSKLDIVFVVDSLISGSGLVGIQGNVNYFLCDLVVFSYLLHGQLIHRRSCTLKFVLIFGFILGNFGRLLLDFNHPLFQSDYRPDVWCVELAWLLLFYFFKWRFQLHFLTKSYFVLLFYMIDIFAMIQLRSQRNKRSFILDSICLMIRRLFIMEIGWVRFWCRFLNLLIVHFLVKYQNIRVIVRRCFI